MKILRKPVTANHGAPAPSPWNPADAITPAAPGLQAGRGDAPPNKHATDRSRAARKRDWRPLFGMIGTLIALALGWCVAEGIFHLTGRPPAILAYLLTIMITILGAGFVGNIWARLTGKYPRDHPHFDDILDALERISHGDFDVQISPEARGPFNDELSSVIASVNKMARDLGTIEQQRQEFVSNVSHEIHSPLTSIKGFADLLRDPALPEADRRHYLGIINAECDRLSGLSDNLLRLSALDNTELTTTAFRLDEQLQSVILTLEPQWHAKDLDIELDASPSMIEADADLLRQVWINLIQNAIKFTPDKGRIRITVCPAVAETAESANPTLPRALSVTVTDSGIGISPADQPHVFERFYRADKARTAGGNGLGLALAKRITDLHAGHISLTSTPGSGTSFSVVLPSSR